VTSGAPPPPPPPVPNLAKSESAEPISGLAAALQAAKLKKTNGVKTGSSENGSSSGYGTVGRNSANGGGGGGGGGGGMASMMDEMQKTLARRRAKVDRSSEEPDSGEAADQGKEKGGSPGKPYPVSGGGSQAGSESPKPGRRRHSTRGSVCGLDTADIMSQSVGAGPESMNGTGGGSAELEAMKQDILREMRKEIAKAKLEIIEVIRQEMSRR